MPATRPPFAALVRGTFAPTHRRLSIALALACTASLALAQTPAQRAADPATALTAPAAWAVPQSATERTIELPTDIEAARTIWRRANERVAEFPRGHADLLRLEASTPAAATAPATSGPALDMAQAQRLSLRQRPDLFVRAGMNAPERGKVQSAYVAHVREVQRAWISAVAARHSLQLMTASLEAASTGVELGQRMVQAGNWSQARLMREQLIEASARQAWASAHQAQRLADSALAVLLGHWDAASAEQALAALPAQLPALPEALSPGPGLDPAQVEAAVLASHPTLAWRRLEAQRLNSALGQQRSEAWLQALDTALQTTVASPWSAPEIQDLRLLRDHALERAVSAEADLMAAAAARRAMARTAWEQLQAQHASARLAQNGVARLQTALKQETLLRYNGMLLSTWDLLAQARERMASLDAASTAQRDFWLAQTDWQALLAGGDYETPSNAAGRKGSASAAPGH
jgi:hypothetical protein